MKQTVVKRGKCRDGGQFTDSGQWIIHQESLLMPTFQLRGWHPNSSHMTSHTHSVRQLRHHALDEFCTSD